MPRPMRLVLCFPPAPTATIAKARSRVRATKYPEPRRPRGASLLNAKHSSSFRRMQGVLQGHPTRCLYGAQALAARRRRRARADAVAAYCSRRFGCFCGLAVGRWQTAKSAESAAAVGVGRAADAAARPGCCLSNRAQLTVDLDAVVLGRQVHEVENVLFGHPGLRANLLYPAEYPLRRRAGG